MISDLGNLEFVTRFIYCTSAWGWDVKDRETGQIALGGIVAYKGRWSGRRALEADIRNYVIPNITDFLQNPVFEESSSGVVDLKIIWTRVNGVGLDIWKVGVDGEVEGDAARATVRRTADMDKDERLVAHLTAVRDVLAAKFG